MAVAFDTCTSGSGTGTSISFSHTCTGSDLVLYAYVTVAANADFNPAATYNSVSMTLLQERVANAYYIALFRLVNPATGANTLAVTGLPGGGQEAVIAVSFSGVDQTTPDDTPVYSDSGAASSVSDNVSSATGNMVLDGVSVQGNRAITQGADQTIPTNGLVDQTQMETAVSYESGAATNTMSWSWTGNARVGHIAVDINAAASSSVIGSVIGGKLIGRGVLTGGSLI